MNLTLANASYLINEQLKLAYYDSDAVSDKPVVVLLHGYCGSSAYFSRLAPLLESSYRLLIPDLIGHGASTADTKPVYNLQEQAAWLAGWLQATGVQQAHVFGHSLGGYITLALAEHKPALLQSFGLLHSTALADSEQSQKNRELAVQTIEEQGVRAFVEGLIPKLIAADHPQRDELLRYGIEIGYQTAAEAAIGFARGMKERPARLSVIEQATLPVLLVAGAKDGVISNEATFSGRQASTHCQIIEEAGHMGMLEEPEQMAAILQQFIGKQ